MNLKCGIIGMPNAGKSTLFNALLKKQVALAANYPFATIEPNVGVVPVPDARLVKLAALTQSEEHLDKLPPLVPATVEFVDIAGLVKGASTGEGLGNKFLSHIREVDIICHVVRAFTDPDVIHVAGDVDPKRDEEIIATELILADLQTLNKQAEPRGVVDKKVQERWELVKKLKEQLNLGVLAQKIISDPLEALLISDLHLLTMKPVLHVANVSEEQLSTVIPRSASWRIEGSPAYTGSIVKISAKIESELADLSEAEQREYLKDLGVEKSGLERLIQCAYQKLGLISFLTAGEIEVRAWTIKSGTKAPQAAGVIHTDFEKKFIKAEIFSYPDLIAIGSRLKAKEQGKMRLEGKDYVMQDGDVVEFKIGA